MSGRIREGWRCEKLIRHDQPFSGFPSHPRTTGNPVSGCLSELLDFGSNPGVLRGETYSPKTCLAMLRLWSYCTAARRQRPATTMVPDGRASRIGKGRAALSGAAASNNPNLCFNWFVPQHIRRDAGEALSIRQMIETLVLRHGIDRGRIFVTGLSAGGAMTSVMLATYPDVFAGGAIIAGLPYGCASSVPEAFDRMRDAASPRKRTFNHSYALLRPTPAPGLPSRSGKGRQIIPSCLRIWRRSLGNGAMCTRLVKCPPALT